MSVKNIIKEEILQEAKLNDHALHRVKERLNRMKIDNDLTPREIDIISSNLQKILEYDFSPKKSYGILLGTFKPNPQSRLYTDTNKWDPGIPYYEIYGEGLDDVVKDSTGEEFWAIVRENIVTTVMLRKNNQREFALNDREDNGGLGVQVVSINIDNLIADIEAEKQRLAQQSNKNANVINIDGVKWVVDNVNQKVFQKNKPERYVALDDVFDHFDEKTVEMIYNLI